MTGALDGVQLRLIRTIDDVDECRRWAGERRETPLFADTESGGLSPHRTRWRLGQLGDLRTGWAFPAERWGGPFLEILSRYEGEIGFHNSPYDSQVLMVHGGWKPPWHKIHDTLLAGHIADSLRLAALKPRAVLEVDRRAMAGEHILDEGMRKQHWTWDTVPGEWEPYWTYGALDPVLAAHLWTRFGPAVTTTYRHSYDLERAAARICANMMMAGMRIDPEYISARMADVARFTSQAMPWLRGEFGIETVNSSQQLAAALNAVGVPTVLFTKTGQPQMDKAALDFYAAEFPQHAQLITTIKYARKAAQLTGLLTRFLELRGADDIMHYSIWSCRARTSRMSVTDPAMQTFDRDEPIIRGSFIPRAGHVFVCIDADQIEARLAAHFSGDENMIFDFIRADREHLSFFVEMASKIYSTKISKKDPRYTWTKNATYGQIYGAGLEKAAATAGVPVAQMMPVYSSFRQLYPRVGALMDQLIREGKKAGRPGVATLTGRMLYTYRGKEYALLNTKIQGSAAEILKTNLVKLEAAGYGPYLRLPMHDEVVAEVPREHAEFALADMTRILTDRTSFAIPITWSGSILEDRWRKT
ncbi:MAG TPA: DNA polymerase [Streptosporangiaceae bacterium]